MQIIKYRVGNEEFFLQYSYLRTLLNQEYHSLKFQHITISCVKSLYARAFHSVFCTYLARVNDRLADQSNVHFFLYFKPGLKCPQTLFQKCTCKIKLKLHMHSMLLNYMYNHIARVKTFFSSYSRERLRTTHLLQTLISCMSKLFESGSITKICCHFKTQKCLTVSRNNEIIVKFVKNYHPSAIKLSISASGQRQSRPVWIET